MIRECKAIKALFDLFFNREINKKQKRTLEAHLKFCETCRSEFQEEKLLIDSFQQLPEISCPEDVTKAIYHEILPGQHRYHPVSYKKKSSWRLGWRPAIVAITVVIIIIFTTQHPWERSTKPEYTPEEIEKAQELAKWSLVYTAQIVKKSEKKGIEEALVKQVPKTLRKSFKKVMPILRGGE